MLVSHALLLIDGGDGVERRKVDAYVVNGALAVVIKDEVAGDRCDAGMTRAAEN